MRRHLSCATAAARRHLSRTRSRSIAPVRRHLSCATAPAPPPPRPYAATSPAPLRPSLAQHSRIRPRRPPRRSAPDGPSRRSSPAGCRVAPPPLVPPYSRRIIASALIPSHCIPQSSAMTVPLVDLYTLKQATLNFSETHVIGQGGFGIVYKGQLPDGRTIAVKRLRQSARTRKGKCDFTREVEVIVRLWHGNLVPLLAYCNEGDERILVYVYMPNKSLDLYIFELEVVSLYRLVDP
uniref:Putative receptor-like kinase n=1 Tax=Hordeum vulgare subsp. vulgare TaxID=112509 RepID=E5F4N0_HORVV|nr:putative receptor-like kinase [Hordeum vulgare subsp. vulgare]